MNLRSALTGFFSIVLVVFLSGWFGLARTGLVFNDNLATSIPIGGAIVLGCYILGEAIRSRN